MPAPKPTVVPAVLAVTSLTAGIVACWPLNEGSGTSAADIKGGGVLDCSGAGVSWSSSPVGLLTVGSPSRASLATPAYLKLQPGASGSGGGLSLLWLGKVLGSLTTNRAGFAGLAETSLDNYDINNFSGKFSGGSNNNGTGTGYVGTIAPASGSTYNVALRVGNPIDGAASNVWIQDTVNGVIDTPGSTVSQPVIVYNAGSTVFLGTYTGQADTTNLRHDLLVIWNRLLLASEVTSLNSDPYQIFAPASVAHGAALIPHL